MNNMKHKSIVPKPGVKRIQNYVFKFEDFLGQGNFSTVYKGINEKTNQTVAIKYISLNSLTCQRLKQLLDQQIEVLTSLSHPNIVRCHEVLKSSRYCYIITELCDKGDLQGLLKKKRVLSEEQAIPYIRDIFQGLYYLSKKHIVHRDIKLANIFLNQGKAKIADFGFAQKATKQFNDGKIGTPLCMSPQGFLQNLYGCKTDVWAFGIILYQLTHGRLHLDQCKNEQMLRQQIQIQIKINQLNHDLSFQFKQLLIRCLDVNPCTRLTFQQMKNTSFIQRITNNRIQPFSLREIKYVHKFSSQQCEKYMVSLKNLDQVETNQFQNKGKNHIKITSKDLNINYGTKKICQQQGKFSKQRFKHRPSISIQMPSIQFIVPSTSQQTIGSSQQNEIMPINTSNNTFLQCQQKEVSHQSTNDGDFLDIPSSPNTPFRRHKGSFQIGKNQDISASDKRYLRATISAKVSLQQAIKATKKQEHKAGIDQVPPHDAISNNKRLLNGFIKYNETIGLIHYCRLLYKYISELKRTQIYHQGNLNLKYYSNFLLNILNELDYKITSDGVIVTKINGQGDTKQKKLIKMRKVIQDYILRYKPNLEKERADYLNRNAGQIRHILNLDNRFIADFYIVDKSKLIFYNQKLIKFTQMLQKSNRYQNFADFDSNIELQESLNQVKNIKVEKIENSIQINSQKRMTFQHVDLKQGGTV